MPPKKHYCAYLEPNASSTKVPRQTTWSQQQKEPAASGQASELPADGPIPAADRPLLPADGLLHADESMQGTGLTETCPNSELNALEEAIDLSDDCLAQDEHGVLGEGSDSQGPDTADPDDELMEFLRINSELTLPHQTTTRLQAMLLVITFILSAGLPWTQVDNLLKLLNALLGHQVFPATKYGFRKLWELQQSKRMEIHSYCQTCHALRTASGPDHHQCGTCGDTSTLTQLLKKGCFFITINVKCQLLSLLKSTGELVGKNLEKLSASASPRVYRDITDGELYRRARAESKLKWSDLTVTINSDGSPVFKSSKGSVWPIQLCLNELPVPQRWRNILVGAIWFAKEHPPAHLYLKAFIDHFNKIGLLTWSFSGKVIRSTVNVVCCSVDSPARAAILNAKQYNGYYGCSWCFQKGTLVDGTLRYTMEGNDMMERDHSMVISAMKIAAEKKRPVDGIKGPSAVANLRTLDLVWGFPPDYMHCVLEGVVAQMMDLWLCSTGCAWYIGNSIRHVNDRILKIRPPVFFTRLPRPVSERSYWKATEWKFWLLYYAVPCLLNVLPERYLTHFALLSQSVFTLLKASIEETEITSAERLLKQFVKEMPMLYGANSFTFNVHQLIHLAKSVRMTGPLWATSTFPFEGGNGEILKLVSAAKGVPQQIAERCNLQEVLKSLKRVVPLSPFLNRQQELMSGKRIERSRSVVLGAPLPTPVLEDCVCRLVTETIGTISAVSEYFRAQFRGIIVHSARYQRTERTCSQYVEDDEGKILRVLRVFSIDGRIFLLCQELISEESYMPFLYCIEHPPTNIGLVLLPHEKIVSPCVFVEQNDQSFVAKIPNLHETD